MKLITPFIITLIFLLNTSNIFTQVKVCESKKDTSLDFNNISINKCEVKKETKRKVVRNRIVRKKTNSKRYLNSKKNKLNISSNAINLKLKNKATKIITSTKQVLFNVVDEIPMFISCKNSTKEENKKCFRKKINNHFSKNFHPENLTDININEKTFIQFSIDIYGKIIDSKIKTKKHNKQLNKELNRILTKLPQFIPGKEKGLPVIVTYSFPLNLTIN